MNYYDELGIPQDASPEQIRRAYRAMARLLHPDNQEDEVVKAAAERQMRRLNEMAAVLADPLRRRGYDLQLRVDEAGGIPGVAMLAGAGAWYDRRAALVEAAARNWFWILMGATVLGAAVWYGLARDPRMAEGRMEFEAQNGAEAQAAAPAEARGEQRGEPRGRRRAAEKEAKAAVEIAEMPGAVEEAPGGRSAGGKGLAETERPLAMASKAAVEGLAGVAAAEVPKAAAAVPAGVAAASAEPEYAGTWLYAPEAEEKTDPGLYLPAYIEFMVTEQGERIAGEYRGRYRVPDRAVSPEVALRATGARPGGKTGRLTWTSADGAAGEMEVTLRAPGVMKITWWTTQFGSETGLTSGTAILIRQARR